MDLGLSSLIGGGISAIGNFIAGSKQNKTNLKIARETNQSQMDLARYQADQNLNLWNLNNEYNSPSSQMRRYREAGLNPNLIYGEGSSASAGNSSSPARGYESPTLQRAQVDNSYVATASQNFMQGLTSFFGLRKQEAETKQIYQQIENLKVDNQYKELQVIYQGLVNSKTDTERDMWRDMLNAKKANLLGSAHLSESSALTNDMLRPYLVQQKEAEINLLITRDNDLKYQLEHLRPLQRQKLVAEIANLAAQSDLYRMNAKLSESNIELNRERGKLLYFQEEGQFLENQIKQTLIDNGVNLRGSLLERFINSIMRKQDEYNNSHPNNSNP